MSDGSPFQQLADALIKLRHDFAGNSLVAPLFEDLFMVIAQAATDHERRLAARSPIAKQVAKRVAEQAMAEPTKPAPEADYKAAEARVIDHLTSMTEPTKFAPEVNSAGVGEPEWLKAQANAAVEYLRCSCTSAMTCWPCLRERARQ